MRLPFQPVCAKCGKPLCYCQLVKKKAERICGECLEDEELNDADDDGERP